MPGKFYIIPKQNSDKPENILITIREIFMKYQINPLVFKFCVPWIPEQRVWVTMLEHSNQKGLRLVRVTILIKNIFNSRTNN